MPAHFDELDLERRMRACPRIIVHGIAITMKWRRDHVIELLESSEGGESIGFDQIGETLDLLADFSFQRLQKEPLIESREAAVDPLAGAAEVEGNGDGGSRNELGWQVGTSFPQ